MHSPRRSFLLVFVALASVLLGVAAGGRRPERSEPPPTEVVTPDRGTTPLRLPPGAYSADRPTPSALVAENTDLRHRIEELSAEFASRQEAPEQAQMGILDLWLDGSERRKLVHALYYEETERLMDQVRDHVNELHEERVRRLDDLRGERLDGLLPDFERLSKAGFRSIFEQFYGYCLRGERSTEQVIELWLKVADGYRLYIDSHSTDRGRMVRTWLSIREHLTDREWEALLMEFNIEEEEVREYSE